MFDATQVQRGSKKKYAPAQVQLLVGDEPGVFTYESAVFDVDQDSVERQEFDLGPDLVCGRYVRLRLIGKPSKQTFGEKAANGYFVAINNFRIEGINLDQLNFPPAAVEETKK